MNKTILTTVLLLFACSSFGKERTVYLGTSVGIGKISFKDYLPYEADHYKGLYTTTSLMAGGIIKNVSISGGIGYSFFQTHHIPSGESFALDAFAPYEPRTQSYHVIAIPVQVDYHQNIYHKKLFVVIGTGVTSLITVAEHQKTPYAGYSQNLKEIKQTNKPYSFVVTFRTGLYYHIRPRVALYSTFDYGVMPGKYLPAKIGNDHKQNNYTLSGTVGVNVYLYKDSTKRKVK